MLCKVAAGEGEEHAPAVIDIRLAVAGRASLAPPPPFLPARALCWRRPDGRQYEGEGARRQVQLVHGRRRWRCPCPCPCPPAQPCPRAAAEVSLQHASSCAPPGLMRALNRRCPPLPSSRAPRCLSCWTALRARGATPLPPSACPSWISTGACVLVFVCWRGGLFCRMAANVRQLRRRARQNGCRIEHAHWSAPLHAPLPCSPA